MKQVLGMSSAPMMSSEKCAELLDPYIVPRKLIYHGITLQF